MYRLLAVITTLAHGLAPSFKTTISSNSNDWKKGVDEALTLLALERGAAPAPDLAIVTCLLYTSPSPRD